MTPDPNSADDLENAAGRAANGEVNGLPADIGAGRPKAEDGNAAGADAQVGVLENGAAPESEAPTGGGAAVTPETPAQGAQAPGDAAGKVAPGGDALLAEIAADTREIAAAADRYHARAQQREGVIDYLRSELDVLRRGERRGLLRPVLAELCRLRDDLLKQAATLPADFGADKAADLLRSYAESIELTLESNGVVTYAPDSGDPFNPRMHRRVSGEPADDPALAGHVATARRDGYLDIEANSPIAPAEVTVYAAAKAAKGEQEQ